MDREFIKIERTQNGWQLIFQKLYQIAKANAGSQLIAKKPMNVIRNRYRDVLPIDTTRVIIQDPDNDYINANFVKNEEIGRTYILCQGPLQHTCPHFWQMIWEQNTVGVIMLNKCVERGMNKCFPYWPQPQDPPMDIGKFVVENIAIEDEASYRLTHLKLENVETQENRDIQHFHYTRWPDFGVPQNPDVFLDFLNAVRSSGVMDPDKGPAVVHCSAGIGRSGTFCIVDTLLARLEQTRELSSVDLQGTLLSMRKQRLGLVQTADQLRFSYIAILQGALQDLEIEPSNYDDLVEEDDVEDEDDDDDDDDDDDETDSDELEEEDLDARMERKFPNLARQSNSSLAPRLDSDDVPPPLPPRPPDTLRPYSSEEEEEDENSPPPPSPSTAPPPSSSPPPPPSTPPPGPPSALQDNNEDLASKKIKLDSDPLELGSDEEYGFEIPSRHQAETAGENAEVEESSSEEEEEEEKKEEEAPPIPPRNHSLSPVLSFHDYNSKPTGKADIYGDHPQLGGLGSGAGGDIDDISATTTESKMQESGYFLLEGRGKEISSALPLPGQINGIANGKVGEEEGEGKSPSLLPEKTNRIKTTVEEERMLINELDLLEQMVDVSPSPLSSSKEIASKEVPVVPSDITSPGSLNEREALLSESELRRKKLREEKRERLDSKVRDLQEAMRKRDGEFESDWSIPWLLVGFVVMLGYCAYYIIQ